MTTIPFNVVGWVTSAELAALSVLLLILLVYFSLGMILDASAMMTLTVPLSFPVVMQLGYDAVLFGALVVRMTEIALITPPVGMHDYVLSGVARDIPLSTIVPRDGPPSSRTFGTSRSCSPCWRWPSGCPASEARSRAQRRPSFLKQRKPRRAGRDRGLKRAAPRPRDSLRGLGPGARYPDHEDQNT